jgi:hypothetical protein
MVVCVMYIYISLLSINQIIRISPSARISRFHREEPGSIPGFGNHLFALSCSIALSILGATSRSSNRCCFFWPQCVTDSKELDTRFYPMLQVQEPRIVSKPTGSLVCLHHFIVIAFCIRSNWSVGYKHLLQHI